MDENQKYEVIKKLVDTNGNKKTAALKIGCSNRHINCLIKGYQEQGSLKIQGMLIYLDGYPIELPCRYANKIACFTKVYIITNIPLSNQYEGTQREYAETWGAFLRRIHRVICMTEKQSDMFTVEQYFSKDTDFVSVKYIQEQIPFGD
ncbi:MAG: hypothetical protein WCD89_02165 [Anaerocolumna sp.]